MNIKGNRQTQQCINTLVQTGLRSEEEETAVCSVYIPFNETNSLTRCVTCLSHA
jgi:hypothetical protein